MFSVRETTAVPWRNATTERLWDGLLLGFDLIFIILIASTEGQKHFCLKNGSVGIAFDTQHVKDGTECEYVIWNEQF